MKIFRRIKVTDIFDYKSIYNVQFYLGLLVTAELGILSDRSSELSEAD